MGTEKEAVIILGKCREVHKTYGIRVERRDSKSWLATWAFPIKEKNAQREGYDKTVIKGNVYNAEDYPGCPYCKCKEFTVCGNCGHVGCTILKDDVYTCEWCGSQGYITDYTGEGIVSGKDL